MATAPNPNAAREWAGKLNTALAVLRKLNAAAVAVLNRTNTVDLLVDPQMKALLHASDEAVEILDKRKADKPVR